MPFKDEATVPGVPNYTPAQMRRWALVVSSMMTFLAVTSILLRLISRRIRLQKLWLDDYLIMFSMVWPPVSSCAPLRLLLLLATVANSYAVLLIGMELGGCGYCPRHVCRRRGLSR